MGGTVTRALAVADAHYGPAVSECVGVIRHEDASWRSDLGGEKDKERAGEDLIKRERERMRMRRRNNERSEIDREAGRHIDKETD